MESDVLVVDDSAAIRKILQRVLRQTGMAIRTIHEAGDGQEALEILKTASTRPGLDAISTCPRWTGCSCWRP